MKIKRVIDITRTIQPGMVVWSGDATVKIERCFELAKGHDANVTQMSLGVHTGTHVDAPLHFIEGACGVDTVKLENYVGWVRVFELSVSECIKGTDLKGLPIEAGEAVFFKTANSFISAETPFYEPYIYVDESAASVLVEKGVKAVGIDYLSIDGFHTTDYPSHRQLLSQSIAVIEGLDLKEVAPGRYFYCCMPLKIAGSDGSPVRAVLMELEA